MRPSITFVLILSALFFFGCLGTTQQPPPPQLPTPSETPVTCASYRTVEERDHCFIQEAIKKFDLSICNSIANQSLLGDCYIYFSKNKDDPSICASISYAQKRDECYFTMARIKKDLTLCDRLTDESRRRCHLDLGDRSVLCEELEGMERALCFAEARSNLSECESLGDPSEIDDCIMAYALNVSSAEACRNISNLTKKYDCLHRISQAVNNASLCEEIQDPGRRKACVLDYMAKKGISIDTCMLLKDDERMRTICMAKVSKNLSMCDSFTDNFSRDFCLESYAEFFKEPFVCDMIVSYTYRNSCYLNFSLEGQPCLCAKLVPELERDKCYMMVAEKNKNIELCDRVVLDDYRTRCKTNVATILDDPSLCNRVESSYYRISCYSSVILRAKYDPITCERINVLPWRDECYYRAASRLKDQSLCDKVTQELTKIACRKLFEG